MKLNQARLSNIHMSINNRKKIEDNRYITLREAAQIYGCTQKHMNLVARRGKLKAIKMGRNWVTTKEWLDEYKNNFTIRILIALTLTQI